MRTMRIIFIVRGKVMRFRDVEQMILENGWIHKATRGSHHQYVHPTKPGKVTIPNHPGDIDKRTVKEIRKQAGLD